MESVTPSFAHIRPKRTANHSLYTTQLTSHRHTQKLKEIIVRLAPPSLFYFNMIFSSTVLLAIFSLYRTTSAVVEAFVVTTRTAPSSSLSPAADVVVVTPSTCLWMAKEGDGSESNTEQQEAQDTTTTAGDDVASGATDILNSPAFLKRKLEVLKNDVEKIEADLEAALERAEIAKEEWGPQLEDLQREVSQEQTLIHGMVQNGAKHSDDTDRHTMLF